MQANDGRGRTENPGTAGHRTGGTEAATGPRARTREKAKRRNRARRERRDAAYHAGPSPYAYCVNGFHNAERRSRIGNIAADAALIYE